MATFNTVAAVIELVGSQRKLAAAAGVTQQGVSRWLNRLKRIPAEYVPIISQNTGIPKHLIRPDLYDAPREVRSQRRRAA